MNRIRLSAWFSSLNIGFLGSTLWAFFNFWLAFHFLDIPQLVYPFICGRVFSLCYFVADTNNAAVTILSISSWSHALCTHPYKCFGRGVGSRCLLLRRYSFGGNAQARYPGSTSGLGFAPSLDLKRRADCTETFVYSFIFHSIHIYWVSAVSRHGAASWRDKDPDKGFRSAFGTKILWRGTFCSLEQGLLTGLGLVHMAGGRQPVA